MFNKCKQFFKRPLGIATIVVILLIAAGSVYALTRNTTPNVDTVLVIKGDVAQVVSVTGHVQAATDVDLSFQRGGQVTSIPVKVGDHVKQSAVLARIDNSSQAASLAQAQANLDLQNIKYEELLGKTGTSNVQVSQDSVNSAQISLQSARSSLIDSIQSAFVVTDNAIRNNVDTLFDNPTSTPNFGTTVSSNGTSYVINISQTQKNKINSGRSGLNPILKNWNNVKSSLTSESQSDLETTADGIEKNLETTQLFLNDLADIINTFNSPVDSTEQALYSGYRSNVATARSSVTAAISSLRSAIQSYKSSESNLASAQGQLTYKSSSTNEDVRIQKATVASAHAQVAAAKSMFDDGVIYAPADGIVTSIKINSGETVMANSPAVTVVSDSQFEIKADVPEADISKIKITDEAHVTLDAYGSDVVFKAHITTIDLSETIVGGVATYRTTLQFDEQDERIRSGMTANADISGAKHINVVIVPQRAVIESNGKKMVRVVNANKSITETPVTTGLRGSDGNVQILTGLTEGQTVVTFVQQ